MVSVGGFGNPKIGGSLGTSGENGIGSGMIEAGGGGDGTRGGVVECCPGSNGSSEGGVNGKGTRGHVGIGMAGPS